MSKLMLKRTGFKPVEISEEDFTREMAEYIFQHWQETHSELIVNRGEQQFIVVPNKRREDGRPKTEDGEKEKENNQ